MKIGIITVCNLLFIFSLLIGCAKADHMRPSIGSSTTLANHQSDSPKPVSAAEFPEIIGGNKSKFKLNQILYEYTKVDKSEKYEGQIAQKYTSVWSIQKYTNPTNTIPLNLPNSTVTVSIEVYIENDRYKFNIDLIDRKTVSRVLQNEQILMTYHFTGNPQNKNEILILSKAEPQISSTQVQGAVSLYVLKLEKNIYKLARVLTKPQISLNKDKSDAMVLINELLKSEFTQVE